MEPQATHPSRYRMDSKSIHTVREGFQVSEARQIEVLLQSW